MSIRRRQSQLDPPSELPAAHLYLEDVEEITDIFKDLVLKNPYTEMYADMNEDPPRVEYRVGNVVCDTISDLREIGGSSRDFEISAGWEFRLTIDGTSAHWWCVSLLDKNDNWSYYARVREIFVSRSPRLFNALSELPEYVSMPMFILGTVLPFFAHPLLLKAGVPPQAVYTAIAGHVILLATGIFAFLTRGQVEFRYSREAKPLGKRVAEYLPYMLAALAGGIITKLGERLVDAIWP